MNSNSMAYVPYTEDDNKRIQSTLDALLSSASYDVQNNTFDLPPSDYQPRYNQPLEHLPMGQPIDTQFVPAYHNHLPDDDGVASITSNSATSTSNIVSDSRTTPPHQSVAKDQGLSPNNNFEPINVDPITPDSSTSKSSTNNAKSTAQKKQPVKPTGDEGERRRKQLREAQRNYRQRKESRITALENRVQELEALLQTINLTVSAVGNDVVNSNALDAHPQLRYRLSEAMQMCQAEVVQSSKRAAQAVENSGSLHLQNCMPMPMIELVVNPKPPSLMAFFEGDTANKLSGMHSKTINMSTYEFMNALQASSIYLGYMILASPTTPNAALSQYFFLPMGLGNRQYLTSYFAARFHARVSNQDLPAAWANFPFLRFGGAGRHYSRNPSVPDLSAPTFSTSSLSWPTMDIADEVVSHQSKGKFTGEWFDLMDLELYLQRNNIRLVTHPAKKKPGFPPSVSPGTSYGTTVDARLLLRDLIAQSTSLGRCPGFRKSHIEESIAKHTC